MITDKGSSGEQAYFLHSVHWATEQKGKTSISQPLSCRGGSQGLGEHFRRASLHKHPAHLFSPASPTYCSLTWNSRTRRTFVLTCCGCFLLQSQWEGFLQMQLYHALATFDQSSILRLVSHQLFLSPFPFPKRDYSPILLFFLSVEKKKPLLFKLFTAMLVISEDKQISSQLQFKNFRSRTSFYFFYLSFLWRNNPLRKKWTNFKWLFLNKQILQQKKTPCTDPHVCLLFWVHNRNSSNLMYKSLYYQGFYKTVQWSFRNIEVLGGWNDCLFASLFLYIAKLSHTAIVILVYYTFTCTQTIHLVSKASNSKSILKLWRC